MRELFTFDLPIFLKSTVFVDEWGGLSCSVCSVRSPHVKILAIFLTVDGVATTVPSFIMIWLYTVKCGRGKHQSVRGLVLSEDWYWQSKFFYRPPFADVMVNETVSPLSIKLRHFEIFWKLANKNEANQIRPWQSRIFGTMRRRRV